MAKPKKKGGPKQKLSPAAAKAKAIRDKKEAMTPRRRKMKAESQRKDCKKGYDYDHNTKKCVKASHNRGGTQPRSKKDGTKAERKQSKK
jgi:hypothetical protein